MESYTIDGKLYAIPFDQGFVRNQIGYASALSIAMFLLSLVFALIYQRYVLGRDLQGALTSNDGGRK